MKELRKIKIKTIANDKDLKQAAQNLVALRILKDEAEKKYAEKRAKYQEVLQKLADIDAEEKAFMATVKDYDAKIREEIKKYITGLISDGQVVDKVIPVDGGRVTLVKDVDIAYNKDKIIKQVLQGKLTDDILEVNETKLKRLIMNGMKIAGVEATNTVTMKVYKENGA